MEPSSLPLKMYTPDYLRNKAGTEAETVPKNGKKEKRVPESGAGAGAAGGFPLDDPESPKAVNSREGRATLGAGKRCQE